MKTICLALSTILLFCELICYGAPAGKSTFRIMSYNIHHGEGLDGKVDLERIAALIKQEGADIVGLQEVDKGVERTAKRDLPTELAKLTGMACVFSNNFFHQGGDYGNAVLTRFPVVNWTNRHYKQLKPGEQRGILKTTLKVHDRELVFMNTHIDFHPDDAERLSNVEEMKEWLTEAKGKPVVLCGDFNCTPGSRPYQRLAEVLTDAWSVAGEGDGFTIPSRKPTKRIDFIWLSKQPAIVPRRVWVPASNASDHLPLMAELEFK